jgi:sec-independent protein translocase protein TatB
MFDLDGQKLLVIAVVALIFIGPKDLPRAIRTVTTWIRAAQRMAREFQANVDEFVRESELQEMREQARKMAMEAQAQAEKMVDPDGALKKSFEHDPFAPPPATTVSVTDAGAAESDAPAAQAAEETTAQAAEPLPAPAEPPLETPQPTILAREEKLEPYEPAKSTT